MAARKKRNERTVNKREKTIKDRQSEVKAKFLEKLKEMPIIQVAASQTGIHRSTYYQWRDEDPIFKKECNLAYQRGVDFMNDMMESILVKNAKADKLTAIIFWLKNHHPAYNDKRYHEHEHYFREKEDLLTDERKAQIAQTIANWSTPPDEEEDERDEDYEEWRRDDGEVYEPTMEERQARAKVPQEAPVKKVERKLPPPEPSEDVASEVKEVRPAKRSKVARIIVPKKMSKRD